MKVNVHLRDSHLIVKDPPQNVSHRKNGHVGGPESLKPHLNQLAPRARKFLEKIEFLFLLIWQVGKVPSSSFIHLPTPACVGSRALAAVGGGAGTEGVGIGGKNGVHGGKFGE